MRNGTFKAGFTLIERLDAIGIQGVVSATGVVAFREHFEASRFKRSFSGFWGGIGQSGIIRDLVSLDTDFDLNSMEPDGKWISPLTAKASRDDIVHVNEVSQIGPAANYPCRGTS